MRIFSHFKKPFIILIQYLDEKKGLIHETLCRKQHALKCGKFP